MHFIRWSVEDVVDDGWSINGFRDGCYGSRDSNSNNATFLVQLLALLLMTGLPLLLGSIRIYLLRKTKDFSLAILSRRLLSHASQLLELLAITQLFSLFPHSFAHNL